jgi:hypothetical protein
LCHINNLSIWYQILIDFDRAATSELYRLSTTSVILGLT